MADNVTVDNGGLTDFTLATDKIGGVDWQYCKVVFGSDGTATIVDASNPVPVTIGTIATADADTGAGTATTAGVLLLVPASGGPVAAPGDGTLGLKVNATTVPAAARTSDSVSAALAVDKLMQGLTTLTPTFASIDVASSGDNTLVSAQGSGNIILVHQVFLVASAAVTIRFESGAGGTALTGQMQVASNSGFVLPFNPVGWFKTATNTLLNLELSGATSVDGVLGYTVVT